MSLLFSKPFICHSISSSKKFDFNWKSLLFQYKSVLEDHALFKKMNLYSLKTTNEEWTAHTQAEARSRVQGDREGVREKREWREENG